MRNSNWIQENCSTTGTGGTLTLTGAVAGFVPFSSRFANGVVVHYDITDGNNRESGVATLTNATTLTKVTIWEKLESGVLSELPATGLSLTGSAKISMAADSESTISVAPRERNLNASANYLVDAYMGPTLTTGAITPTNLGFSPLFVNSPCVISGLGINVTVLGASSIIQLGLYAMDGLKLRQLRRTSDIDVSTGTGSTGFKSSAFTGGNIGLKPGMYYTCYGGSGAAVTVDMVGSGLRHPFFVSKGKYKPNGLFSAGAGAVPLAASYGPVDHNWANDNAQNQPHIVGLLV